MPFFLITDKRKDRFPAFTLVEVIVVMVILAILAAMLIPSLTKYIDKSDNMKYISDCRNAVVAAQSVTSEAYARKELNKTPISDYYDRILTLAELDDRCSFESIELMDGSFRIDDLVISDGPVYVHYSAAGGLEYDKYEILESPGSNTQGGGSSGGGGSTTLSSVMTTDGIYQYVGTMNVKGLKNYLKKQNIDNNVYLENNSDKIGKDFLNKEGINTNHTSVISVQTGDNDNGTIAVTQYLYFQQDGDWFYYGSRDISATVITNKGNGTISFSDDTPWTK